LRPQYLGKSDNRTAKKVGVITPGITGFTVISLRFTQLPTHKAGSTLLSCDKFQSQSKEF
jgi:hypothetical protein